MMSQKNQKNNVKADEYAKASEHIMCAISALGDKAKSGDSHAKDVIANLSVVLFDLK
jgi:hypothetical protein